MHNSLLIAAFAVFAVALAAPVAAQDSCAVATKDENIAIARQWHEEVINRRNPAVLKDILAATVVHHAAGGYPEEMDSAGVTAMMDDFLGAFSDLSYTFDGRKVTWTGVNIFRIDCGRIAEVWSEVDALSRNRQLTE